jgi:hypothetical protein
MKKEERKRPERISEIRLESVVEQEMVIRPDGRVEIPWITPKATRLVLEVFQAVSDEPFPVGVVSGNLYCG